MKVRRILAWALALTLLLGALSAATAATSPSTETYCSSERNNHQHRFQLDEGYAQDFTCDHPVNARYVCQYCGYVTYKEYVRPHTWSGWTVTQKATCTAAGTQKRTCKVCGKVETRTLARTDHNWGGWKVVTEATDHSAGVRERACKVCGAKEKKQFYPDGTLRRGDKGDAVKAFQEALICYGALAEGTADGSYGAATEAAVKAVQTAEGLTVDGIAWPQIQGCVGHQFGEWETVAEPTDFSMGLLRRVCARCGKAEEMEEAPSPMYRRGDSGDGVKAMQEALNAKGYDCGAADGSFGAKTESAVKRFETDNGITGDGIAWPGVLKLLGIGGDAPGIELMNGDLPKLLLMKLSVEDGPGVEVNFPVDYKLELTNCSGDTLHGITVTVITLSENGEWEADTEVISKLPKGQSTTVEGAFALSEVDAGCQVEVFARAVGMKPDDSKVNGLSNAINLKGLTKTSTPNAYLSGDMVLKVTPSIPTSKVVKDGDGITFDWTITNYGNEDIELLGLTVYEKRYAASGDEAYDPAQGVKNWPGEQAAVEKEILKAYAGNSLSGTVTMKVKGWTGLDRCTYAFQARGQLQKQYGIVRSNAPMFTYVMHETPPLYPILGLKVKQTSPVKEAYAVGEEIAFDWEITNGYTRDCHFGEVRASVLNTGGKRFQVDSTDQIVAPKASTGGSFTVKLDQEHVVDGKISYCFYAYEWDDVDIEKDYLLYSHSAEFTFPISDTAVLPEQPSEAAAALEVHPLTFKLPGEYAAGDKLSFDAQLCNTGSADFLSGLIVMRVNGHSLDGGITGMVKAGEKSKVIPCEYELQPEDIEAGSLTVIFRGSADVEDLEGGVQAEDFAVVYDFPKGGEAGTFWIESDPVPAAPYHDGDKIDVNCRLCVAEGDSIGKLEYLSVNGNGEIHWESWMDQPLPGGSVNDFKVTLEVGPGDVDDGFGGVRIVGASKTCSAQRYIHFVIQKDEPSVLILPSDITGMGGKLTDALPVGVTIYNNGNADLKLIQYTSSGNGGTVMTADVNDLPEWAFANLPAGGSVAFTNWVLISSEDRLCAQAHDGLFDRLLEVSAMPLSPGAPVSDQAELHFAFKETEVHETTPPEADGDAGLDISVTALGGDGVFYPDDVITFEVTVKNKYDIDLSPVEILAFDNDSTTGNTVVKGLTIQAKDTYTDYYTYTVTGPDADAGQVKNTCRAWDGIAKSSDHYFYSEPVSVNVAHKETPDTPKGPGASDEPITVVKKEASIQPPMGYTENDMVIYEITVTNNTEETLSEVQVYDPLKGENEDAMVDIILNLEPHKSETVTFFYIVTGEDAKNGTIENTASATCFVGDEQHEVSSNTVTVHTYLPDYAVVKEIISKPGDPKGYVEGETIRFRITVTNNSKLPSGSVPLYDYLNHTTEGQLIQTFSGMGPGESRTQIYEYVVQKSDESAGAVVNQAAVVFQGFQYLNDATFWSNEVRATVIGKQPDPAPHVTPAPRTQETALYCRPFLTGVGAGAAEYALDLCDRHAGTAAKAKALIDAAGDGEARLAAWQQVIALWTEALNGEYDALCEGLSEADRAVVVEERAQFYIQLTCLRDELALIWPEDPVRVAETVANELTDKCAEVCYEAHTAPEARIDSLITGDWARLEAADTAEECLCARKAADEGQIRIAERLCDTHRATDEAVMALVLEADTPQALIEAWRRARTLWLGELDALVSARCLRADPADQELIRASREAFGNWLAARQRLLMLLYPERDEIMGEVIARSVRARVLATCGGADGN